MGAKSFLQAVAFHGGREGVTVGTKIESVSGYGRCWVWDMRLEKDEDVRLEIGYSSEIVNERYGVPFEGIWFVYYPLRTGSNWAGSIGRLAISVSMPVETIMQIGPPGYTRTSGLIEWHLSDYEPREDLFAVLEPYRTSQYISQVLPKEAGAKIDTDRRAAFAESFLTDMPRYRSGYQSMSGILRQFTFPPAQGIERVVRESHEIMRLPLRPSRASSVKPGRTGR
jgi:hypothetical protein